MTMETNQWIASPLVAEEYFGRRLRFLQTPILDNHFDALQLEFHLHRALNYFLELWKLNFMDIPLAPISPYWFFVEIQKDPFWRPMTLKFPGSGAKKSIPLPLTVSDFRFPKMSSFSFQGEFPLTVNLNSLRIENFYLKNQRVLLEYNFGRIFLHFI